MIGFTIIEAISFMSFIELFTGQKNFVVCLIFAVILNFIIYRYIKKIRINEIELL
jgi:hypothetical protein